jgi:hypothetical protein
MTTETYVPTQFEVRNRITGAAQFTAKITCSPDASSSIKLGLAVLWAREIGVDLSCADLSGADLSDANLSDANLSCADLSGADMRGANLSGADLSGADMRGANLSGADLSGADMRGANLSGADMRGANLIGANLRECPVKIPDIHKAVYEAASQPNALDMGTWHCGTSHCRAGWVVTLAGEGGKALEYAMGTPAAATAIYLASDPNLEKVPNFYATNDEAMADMKRLANQKAA